MVVVLMAVFGKQAIGAGRLKRCRVTVCMAKDKSNPRLTPAQMPPAPVRRSRRRSLASKELDKQGFGATEFWHAAGFAPLSLVAARAQCHQVAAVVTQARQHKVEAELA